MNSYLILEQEDSRYKVPNHLLAADEHNGIDVGWVEQMLPFIEEFSRTGQNVLDPFAGLGTTLVAANKLQRQAFGIEISKQRCAAIEQRLEILHQQQLLGAVSLQLIQNDALSALQSWPYAPVHLALSSLPYFSCTNSGQDQRHLYQQANYQRYLDYLEQSFIALRKHMVGGGSIVFMVENIHQANGELLPIAWDIAKRLARHFSLFDERIVLYPNTQRKVQQPLHTKRQHEYALIGKKYLTESQHALCVAIVQQLVSLQLEHNVIGSFTWQYQPHIGDLDLAVPKSAENTLAILRFLASLQPMQIWSWNQRMHIDQAWDWQQIFSKQYLRILLDLGADRLQIDLSFTN